MGKTDKWAKNKDQERVTLNITKLQNIYGSDMKSHRQPERAETLEGSIQKAGSAVCLGRHLIDVLTWNQATFQEPYIY